MIPSGELSWNERRKFNCKVCSHWLDSTDPVFRWGTVTSRSSIPPIITRLGKRSESCLTSRSRRDRSRNSWVLLLYNYYFIFIAFIGVFVESPVIGFQSVSHKSYTLFSIINIWKHRRNNRENKFLMLSYVQLFNRLTVTDLVLSRNRGWMRMLNAGSSNWKVRGDLPLGLEADPPSDTFHSLVLSGELPSQRKVSFIAFECGLDLNKLSRLFLVQWIATKTIQKSFHLLPFVLIQFIIHTN